MSKPSATAPVDTGPVDWLNYGQYANALWSRVQHGFALEGERAARRQDNTATPSGDPLVVGIYGEWGVGKSRLLELVYARAAAASATECAQRVLDPAAYAHSPALRLTVPVWFHPWKYEHEQHLAVPLLMHLADAVGTALNDADTLAERTKEQLQAIGGKTQAVAEALVEGAQWIRKAAKVAHAVASHNLVKTATGIAAGFVGLGSSAEKALDWIGETSKQLAGSGDDVDGPEKDKGGDKGAAKANAPKRAAGDSTPSASADGRYYYNVQKYLREMARITPESATALGLALRDPIQLNFVVFIDDLDRCLPEKAVEVLEVIKTVLNTENFAFLVALDDEVIERGISHRYRDYRFEGAKPQMPITGFEYLEKIVHLPFRLPQLTREQARSFVIERENQLRVPGTPRLWLVEIEDDKGNVTALKSSPMLHILLDSFDAYVPRKLARTMELMSQYQQVLSARRITMQSPSLATATPGVDARLILFCVLMQLFAPEIFRLLRRRPGIFGQWMRANLAENTSMLPVFEWEEGSADRPLVIDVSDADLFRWAALGSLAARSTQPTPPPPNTPPLSTDVRPPSTGESREWAAFISTGHLMQSDRHTIEQLRLPFALAVTDFRATQRHAFSPLRLGAAMAAEMKWTYGSVFDLQPYMQMLANLEVLVAPEPSPSLMTSDPWSDLLASAPSTGGVASDPLSDVMASAPSPAPPRTPGPGLAVPVMPPASPQRERRSLSVRTLLEVALSADASTRASLVERMGLRPGDLIDASTVGEVATALAIGNPGHETRFLAALAALAPYLNTSDLKPHAEAWAKLPAWVPPEQSPRDTSVGQHVSDLMADLVVDTARPYVDLQLAGLTDALGLEASLMKIRRFVAELKNAPIGTQQAARVQEMARQLRFPPAEDTLA